MSDWIRLTPQFPSTNDLVVVGRKKTEDETGHYLRYARTENGVLSIRDVPGFFLLDAEALDFAAQLDAVRALVEDLRTAELTCRVQSDLHKHRQNSRDAMEWDAMADRFRAHLAPFEEVSNV